jgi:glucoamylase
VWPLLTGERAHYELAAGRDIAPLIKTYERFATMRPDDAGAGVGRADMPEAPCGLGSPRVRRCRWCGRTRSI